MKNNNYHDHTQDTTFTNFEEGLNNRLRKEEYHLDGALPSSPVDAFKPNSVDKKNDSTAEELAKWVAKKELINYVLAKKENFKAHTLNEFDYESLNDVERALGVKVTPVTYMIQKPSNPKNPQTSLDNFL